MLVTRIALYTTAVVAAVVTGAGVAHADVTDPVDCRQNPTAAHCDVTATLPGRDGSAGRDGGAKKCRYPDGRPSPCHVEGKGFLGSDGCFYEPSQYTGRGPHGEVPPEPGPGRWYFRNGDARWCSDGGWWVWIPDNPHMTPAELAREAIERLAVARLPVRLSPPPPAQQLVHLPTWMWVDRAVWAPRSATAVVPGLSVTATATPTRMVVSTGDGGVVTCRGPGTPWTPVEDPDASSPTCGHTYTRPGAFTLTAEVGWSVSWAGGGQSGTAPAVTTTSTRTVLVTESQALNST